MVASRPHAGPAGLDLKCPRLPHKSRPNHKTRLAVPRPPAIQGKDHIWWIPSPRLGKYYCLGYREQIKVEAGAITSWCIHFSRGNCGVTKGLSEKVELKLARIKLSDSHKDHVWNNYIKTKVEDSFVMSVDQQSPRERSIELGTHIPVNKSNYGMGEFFKQVKEVEKMMEKLSKQLQKL
ncbi:hypothetical protein J5N97_025686 [Dioscorea zingiberensis]|uniref:Uncharacterized protein n=1 Tax=Dioscorea zingiberensis TaxID=325984 RepID=A0A9D5H5Z8_9LILI|nr:hypothetical protein J5N97_025686 [Dioscorea zingiberensis]